MLSMILSVYGFIALAFLVIMLIALVSMLHDLHGEIEHSPGMICWLIFAIIIVSCIWPTFIVYMIIHRDKSEGDSDEDIVAPEEILSGIRETGD